MSGYKEGKYNYETIIGYNTPEWEITDISEDLSLFEFKIDWYNRNYAEVKVLERSEPLDYIDGSIKIPSKIEEDRDGIWNFNIVMTKNNQSEILLSGLKIVRNGIQG